MSTTQPTTRQEAEAFLRDKLGDANTDTLLKMVDDMAKQKSTPDEIQQALGDEVGKMAKTSFSPIIIILIGL